MIKTWQQRCEEHPDHDGIVSDRMIHTRMQEEIDELRDALEQRQWQSLTEDEIKVRIQRVMPHFGFDPKKYDLGRITTVLFYGLVKETEAKLKEKNT